MCPEEISVGVQHFRLKSKKWDAMKEKIFP
jgi:hypothetical protein